MLGTSHLLYQFPVQFPYMPKGVLQNVDHLSMTELLNVQEHNLRVFFFVFFVRSTKSFINRVITNRV